MENNRNTAEDYFKSKGYKRFNSPDIYGTTNVVCIYQKLFSDEIGKKYYITIKLYENWWGAGKGEKYLYEYECQLHKKGTNAPFNITFFDDWKLDEVENYVESLFSTGELEYEERWVGR